jgi:DNA replication protein DnaC
MWAVVAKDNVVFLGPPGTGKTHRRSVSRSGHVRPGTGRCSPPRDIGSLGWPKPTTGRLQQELVRLGRYPLIVIHQVGYIPFEPEAGNLFFQLAPSRYERASLIVTSNKPFGGWGEVFGDDVVAAAMIDRLVHHAE